MSSGFNYLSTGLPELDKLLKGLMPGDNIVWYIDDIEDYKLFVEPFCQKAETSGQKLIYFRYSKHDYLINKNYSHEVHYLNPELSFERFINSIHTVIEENGRGGFYVFDCLTDLASIWYSDKMLGNFFVLTCPYLLDINALAYFPVLKNSHSSDAIQPIVETTQVFIDIYKYDKDIYLHPIKVQQRYSSTMYMLHKWENRKLILVTQSAINAEIFTSSRWLGKQSANNIQDIWNKTFMEAAELLRMEKSENIDKCLKEKLTQKIIRMIMSRDEKIVKLIKKNIFLEELINIGNRMIGTGLIGGKSVGMLLARAILKKNYPKNAEKIEIHDSFYIGSDLFYSYLIRNGCWWMIQQRKLDIYLHNSKHARRLIYTGDFSEEVVRKFSNILDYYGQSPIIVRSSSLLEDNFGNAFSGKYESVFCPNQGPREKRLEDFINAVKTIYASTMNEDALIYREQRKMLDKDEQMSILVQRVSGSFNKNYFYPLVAGVGYSYNQYVWNESIDPKAGVLRLVFGLGTRAVDKNDDDYARLVSLNAPNIRPEENLNQIKRYSQRNVDIIDLDASQLLSIPFEDVYVNSENKYIQKVVSKDYEAERKAKEMNLKKIFPWVITFDGLFNNTNFIEEMKQILKTIQDAYNYPVDIEFTANFKDDNDFSINILQCRPLETKEDKLIDELNNDIDNERIILQSHGSVIGQSRESYIDLIIYVVPSAYSQASLIDKYSIARLIGKVLNLYNSDNSKKVMLVGPGRWGTTTPSLGVPVTFSEIRRISYLCEIVKMHDNLIPDVSMGTHFFNDLVEFNILYTALYPDKEKNMLNYDFLDNTPTLSFSELAEDIEKYKDVLRIIDIGKNYNTNHLNIYANSLKQKVVCYLDIEK